MVTLTEPQKIDEIEFNDFVNEFKAANERLVPYSLNQKGMDFHTYIKALVDESLGKGVPENWVPASTYFLVDDQQKVYGAVNIRHRLTDNLMIEGGHVGFGIRPSLRNTGYGTRILKLQAISKKSFGPISALDRGSKSSTYSSMPPV